MLILRTFSNVCKDPSSSVKCSCGEHSSKDHRPAVADVIKSIESTKSKTKPSDFSVELLSKLKSHKN